MQAGLAFVVALDMILLRAEAERVEISLGEVSSKTKFSDDWLKCNPAGLNWLC
jgi:hypothetical protein